MSAFTLIYTVELISEMSSNFTLLPNRIHILKLDEFHDTATGVCKQDFRHVFRSSTSKQSYKLECSELQVTSLGIELPAVKAPGLLRSAM